MTTLPDLALTVPGSAAHEHGGGRDIELTQRRVGGGMAREWMLRQYSSNWATNLSQFAGKGGKKQGEEGRANSSAIVVGQDRRFGREAVFR